MDQNNPIQTPSEDLRKSALAQYEEAATVVNNWSSDIPRVINYYYDMHSDKSLDKEDIESLGFVFEGGKLRRNTQDEFRMETIC